MTQRRNRRRDGWRERMAVLALLRDAAPAARFVLVVATALGALVPTAFALAVGHLINQSLDAGGAGLRSDAGRGMIVALAAVVGTIVAERVLPALLESIKLQTVRQIDGAIRRRLFALASRHRTISHLESPSFAEQAALTQGGLFGTPGAAAVASVGIAGRYLQTLAAAGVIAWFSPVLAIATVVVIVLIRRRWHDVFGELADSLIAGGGRAFRASYFSGLLLGPASAREVRTLGLHDWAAAWQKNEWAAAVDDSFRVRANLRRRADLELGALGLLYVITFVLATRSATQGTLSIGLLAAILQAEFTAAQLIAPGEADYATSAGLAALHAERELERLVPPEDDGSTAEAGPTGPVAGAQIAFEDVTFAYPGGSPVVAGFDLTIEPGASLAIVGLNGAGKTTLVKLLSGLYRPGGGHIRIDGADPVTTGSASPVVAGIFQDFVRYELTVRENVTLALDAPPGGDDPHLHRALDRAGATEIVDALPDGVDTVLSAARGGVDLSGGQWQRIALARALYAVERGARILVLDEPTANLDVRAEADLYGRFLDLTAGVTSIIISHRFSTVRRAERIVVIDGGKVIEDGPHEELVAAGGEYARLYTLQVEQVDGDDGGPHRG